MVRRTQQYSFFAAPVRIEKNPARRRKHPLRQRQAIRRWPGVFPTTTFLLLVGGLADLLFVSRRVRQILQVIRIVDLQDENQPGRMVRG